MIKTFWCCPMMLLSHTTKHKKIELICDKLISWHVDLVAIDLVRVDLMTLSLIITHQ